MGQGPRISLNGHSSTAIGSPLVFLFRTLGADWCGPNITYSHASNDLVKVSFFLRNCVVPDAPAGYGDGSAVDCNNFPGF